MLTDPLFVSTGQLGFREQMLTYRANLNADHLNTSENGGQVISAAVESPGDEQEREQAPRHRGVVEQQA